MERQVWLVFMGEARHETAVHAHESPPVMTIPLIILAALAALGGSLNLPGIHSLGHWLGHTLGESEIPTFNVTVALTSTLLALAAIGLAYALYGRQPLSTTDDDPLARRLGFLFVAFNRRWWLDEGVEVLVKRPYRQLSLTLAQADDSVFAWVEGLLVKMVRGGSTVLRRTQTGQLNWNVAGIVIGLIVVLMFLRLT
jgi:NADH-quinone oxidoreductase subunit L